MIAMQIRFNQVTFSYHAGTKDKEVALKNVDLTIDTARILGICGATGSGKSTLIRHLNGILKPTTGQVCIDGENLHQSKVTLRRARQRIGMTFQFPERQLFGRTVWEELAYTLEQHRISAEEIERRILTATQMLCFDIARLRDRSPFALSRGEQRKLGIAIMLTLQPDLIVLDEPTAGMDRRNAMYLLDLLHSLHQEQQIGLILVSHELDLFMHYVDDLLVLRQGQIAFHGPVQQAICAPERLEQSGLALPPLQRTLALLQQKFPQLRADVRSVDDAVAEIVKNCAVRD
ncbi:ABC transporter related protein [Candidatus Vecturithrix granuli]|uniref:ABC transporter related protein n=1 Tax=Vecturithrix granuli TaxID=1499967 RepID=A0A081C9X5_VECG1|nr:ABC transporter related protein [Candidatus Vecturithrix granuli]